MPSSVEAICSQLAQDLLPAPQVRGLYQRWRREAGASAADAQRFLRWLVANHYINMGQARALWRNQAAQDTPSAAPPEATPAREAIIVLPSRPPAQQPSRLRPWRLAAGAGVAAILLAALVGSVIVGSHLFRVPPPTAPGDAQAARADRNSVRADVIPRGAGGAEEQAEPPAPPPQKKPDEPAGPPQPPGKGPERAAPLPPPPDPDPPAGNDAPPPAEEGTFPFTIKECFGVSHPRQIIDFDLPQRIDLKHSRVLGPDGKEVPFQLLRNGRLAVEADLPAAATRTWKLQAGQPPGPFDTGLRVVEEAGYYEIVNGLTGVRVPKAPADLKPTPAPVQGVRLRDGQWTARGPNHLSLAAKRMSVRFLESGPLQVVVRVAYVYDRPEYVHHGKGAPPEGKRYPGGEGFYRSTITVQAGQPSILVEEDTDMTLSYSLEVYPEVRPTQARYRGHDANNPANGHEPDGKTYRPSHSRPPMDALVDLQYAKQHVYPRMAVWDPWVSNSGWYWQLYDAQGGNPNLLGLFAGPASRALGVGASGVSVFTDAGPRAGLTVICNRRNPDTTYYPHIRYSWGLFAGVKASDLIDPTQVQTVARQMNLRGGINLNKVHRVQVDYPDPKRGYGTLFLDAAAVQRIIQKLREDKGGPYGKGYYHRLFEGEPSCRELLAAWANPAGGGVQKLAAEIDATARRLLDHLVQGDGIYDEHFHYWHGGLAMTRQGMLLDSLLATGLVGPAEKARLKAAAALYAAVLWDDDFVPLANYAETGVNLGTPNMPVQQTGYRDFFVLLFPEHPALSRHVASVEARALHTLRGIVNEQGAEMGSPHYMAASIVPTLETLLQLQNVGAGTPFQAEPRLARYGEFAMHLLTPPEPRFGHGRKLVSIGDGATESSEVFGVLAAGFRKTNPDLSARLMGAWNESGRVHSGFFGSTVLMIDEGAPAKDPHLGDGNFPGYLSVLRHGWGSPNETALWFINGDFYRDHRHYDQGNVVLYALGAPLSIDWGSMYTPQASGPFVHSVVLPEAKTGHPWDKDRAPLRGQQVWQDSAQDAFASFQASAFAAAHFMTGGLVWRRTVYSLHADEAAPVLVIEDRLEGKGADQPRVWSMNLMAEGDVDTPAGKVTPPLRSNHGKGEQPSAGKVFDLPAGLNRLGFRGQWLIDWDLYTVADAPQQAHVGNWGHDWHPDREKNEFKATNKRPFEERQHILRIRGGGPLTVLLLPRRKGAKQRDISVKRDGHDILVTSEEETTRFDGARYVYRGPGKRVLATFNNLPAEAEGLKIAGGPLEIVLHEGQAIVTAQGPRGARRFFLPGNWRVQAGHESGAPTFGDGEWVWDYPGGEQRRIVLEAR